MEENGMGSEASLMVYCTCKGLMIEEWDRDKEIRFVANEEWEDKWKGRK